jgi:hypothetical protein
MKIKETYIVYSEVYLEFVKLHFCLNQTGSSQKYFMERTDGKITQLSGVEFYELLKDV